LGAVELSGWLEMVVGLMVVMVMMLAALGADAAAGFGIFGFLWFGCSVRSVLWCCLNSGRGSERGGELRGGLVSE
jgi:predicted membrane channel-forming protein YqfA (hemolysin III family)